MCNEAIRKNDEARNVPQLSLDAAVRAVSENSLKIDNPPALAIMLGKRSYPPARRVGPSSRMATGHTRRQVPIGEGSKANSKCRACGKIGHWWKDRPECKEEMKKQFAASRQKERNHTPKHTFTLRNQKDESYPNARNNPNEKPSDSISESEDAPAAKRPKETTAIFRQ